MHVRHDPKLTGLLETHFDANVVSIASEPPRKRSRSRAAIIVAAGGD